MNNFRDHIYFWIITLVIKKAFKTKCLNLNCIRKLFKFF